MFPLTNRNLSKVLKDRHLTKLKHNEILQEYTYDSLVAAENLLYTILTSIPLDQAKNFIKDTKFNINPYGSNNFIPTYN